MIGIWSKIMGYPSYDLNFSQLQDQVKEWSARNFPGSTPYQPLLGAVEEMGELAHAHLKQEQGIRGTPREHYAAKVDAIGDIIVYLADYCWRNGIDMQDAIETTWGMVQQRDWQKNKGDGVSK
jgi:NTP pyrophosphatase (non-canonical NTP hydrolase)